MKKWKENFQTSFLKTAKNKGWVKFYTALSSIHDENWSSNFELQGKILNTMYPFIFVFKAKRRPHLAKFCRFAGNQSKQAVLTNPSVWLDESQILEDGEFILDI